MTASQWFAAGKHPCARDFFRVGAEFPLALSLASWVEAGYGSRTAERSSVRSWRFWAAAAEILCYGVLTDSRDGLGRPFPLLIAGQNRGKGWQQGWQDIPAALERTWAGMEEIAAVDCPDLPTLRTRISSAESQAQMEPPSPAPLAETEMPPDFVHDGERVVLSCPAKEKIGREVVAAAHAALKRRVAQVPTFVFVGGLIEVPRIILFYRPLATSDFGCLWRDETGAGEVPYDCCGSHQSWKTFRGPCRPGAGGKG